MRHIEKLWLAKAASSYASDAAELLEATKSRISPAAALGVGAAVLPQIPWSTLGAAKDKLRGQYHQGELGRASMTDVGRGAGALLGMHGAAGLASRFGEAQNPLLRVAILLAGSGAGAVGGSNVGKAVGQHLYPGSLSDRARRAVNSF